MTYINRVIVFLLLLTINNTLVNGQNNQVDEKGQMQGIWIELYENGQQIKWRYFYKNDKLDSLQISYYRDGKTKSRQMFSDGTHHGLFETYFVNGQLHESFNYINGVVDGEYKFYYENGNLFREGTFKDDKDHGLSIRYHENGNKWIEEYYVDGKVDGEVKKFDKNGKLTKTLKFDKGKRVN